MLIASGWWEWLHEHDQVLWWLGAGSLATLALSVAVVPTMLARMPENYFDGERRPRRQAAHPALRLLRRIVLNILGLALVVAGVAMLVLPGQGILTILIGLGLMNFPGKYRLERWLVSRPAVLRAVNWIRQRVDQPPLRVPGRGD